MMTRIGGGWGVAPCLVKINILICLHHHHHLGYSSSSQIYLTAWDGDVRVADLRSDNSSLDCTLWAVSKLLLSNADGWSAKINPGNKVCVHYGFIGYHLM